ncbi:beta-ketoacyl-[acyl-carrier-protein] synthase family protein [Burkholderia pyrrocinia]|uniref:beta-ketoacyl-[acyl-carrier-protein] synthase family protein n=1 Tax=Burkholderia pyrrocinia TaxID=60550 RepID=UPI0015772486|nr:beta-ketoacyl-[acyl-carrier-protein] synthase family protein [Burkholderia pyrrocinia]NTX31791.1 beta-ketoacyl-[acyl-carrier-protein] synthase family protein [Burkholderia pyrrocinia]QVN23777.1 beta-ketoacyl-[acyl-carrier-protein] synthase family protein [Burkholderia pyrrocinia]
MSDTRRVVVSGVGCLSALGVGKHAVWDALAAGQCGIRAATRSVGSYSVTVPLGEVPDYRPLDHFGEDDLALLDPYAQYAVVAAREALAEARLIDADYDRARTAVILGSGAGGEQAREEAAWKFIGEGRTRCNPMLVPRTNHQASAGFVSMTFGITGPTFVISTGCASANHAIAQAWLMVRHGVVDRAITGGSEANLVYTNIKAFESMRVMSTDTCRPFSLGRGGMTLAEGAGIVVLETLESALARDAPIYAELAGVGMSADASNVVHPSAAGPARAMAAALDAAGMRADDVDYINAHGTGTPVNDVEECKAIRRVFGEHANRMAVSSTKSMHGHALGATGGIEMAATLMAMRHGIAPPTANHEAVDPNCDLDVVPNVARPMTIRAALSNNFAFGGLNAVLALRALS